MALQWRHNERDCVSNHQPHDCLLNRLFRRRSKKISKLRVTGLCEGNPVVTGGFPSQRASNAEKASIWWCHHGDYEPVNNNETNGLPISPALSITVCIRTVTHISCCLMRCIAPKLQSSLHMPAHVSTYQNCLSARTVIYYLKLQPKLLRELFVTAVYWIYDVMLQ